MVDGLRSRIAAWVRDVDWPDLAVLAAVACLPLLSLVHHPAAVLADPGSEAPVKLWVYETFARVGLLGGVVDTAGWPNVGSLNNPDPVGTLVTAALRPVLGRYGAYNALITLQLFADLVAVWLLVRTRVRSRGAALYGAVVFVATPLLLVYCVAGAVTDMLNLWPWALALRAGLRALGTGVRDGLRAGLWAGVGVVTCPYNAVVFSILAVPLLAAVAHLKGDAPWSRVAQAGVGIVVGVALLAGPYAWSLRALTEAPDSQMSAQQIADTRHMAPYPFLEPGHPDRYTAYLSDYVAVGKSSLIERSAGSRYYRAFSPGWSLLAFAAAGLGLRRRRTGPVVWCGAAAFCALASLGPFTPITASWHAASPENPVWLGLQRFWPGAALILEPFRYALPAVLALAVAGAMGVEAVEARVDRRWAPWVGPAALGLWLAELIAVSPVPVPLPVAELPASSATRRLAPDAASPIAGPGAVLYLPYFDRESDRFNRIHFIDQLVSGRAVADEVMGFPARYLRENNYTAALLAAEKPHGRLRTEPADRSRIDADRARLAADGFAAIVLNRAHFADPQRYAEVRALLTPFGEPVTVGAEEVFVLRAP